MALFGLLIALAQACGPYPLPPQSRVDRVTDVLHGVEFVDNYRWLENQYAPETRAWIAAQNGYAETVVGEGPLRDQLRARLRELTDLEAVGSTRRAGDFEYFTMRRVGEEAPVLYRRPLPGPDDTPEPIASGEYEVVLHPADFDPAYRTLVSLMDFSPDGNLMMYSVRQGGADEISIWVRDVTTGEDLPDRLPNALYSGVEFDEDGTGFYYTHRSRETGPRIRHHTLGEDPDNDRLLFGSGYGPTSYIGTDVIEGGEYRMFTVQHGWARNDLFIQRAPAGAIRPIVEGVPAHFQHRFQDSLLYVRTDWNAPNYRLMQVDPANPSPVDWVELIPEADDLLESYQFIDGQIYATYLVDVANEIRVFDMDGRPTGTVEVPANATASIRGGDDGKALLTVTAHLIPSTTFELDLATGERVVTEPPEIEVDPNAYEVTKLHYSSAGGVDAPIYVMHRRGITLDGSHPTILFGYGGFNSNQKPNFSATRLAWLELGGVYAIATLRGGAEFGETWHRDGMLENKQHVFDDFIAASEALIAEGFTNPDKLAISGSSNGGLLVASAMTQRPDLYRAVLCGYPDLDMIRFFEFTDTNNMPALLEYGDARISQHFEAMRLYSPYQAVTDDVEYPAVMLSTGDLDTRVPPHQARRMTARLQAATSSGLPVILWYDFRGGHAEGRGRPMSLRIEDTARELTFLAQQLGLGAEGS